MGLSIKSSEIANLIIIVIPSLPLPERYVQAGLTGYLQCKTQSKILFNEA